MKVRWPFVLLLALGCAAFLGFRWWSHQPVVITAEASPRSTPPPPPPAAGCSGKASAAPVGAAHRAAGRPFQVWGPAAPKDPLPIALMLHGWHADGPGFQGWFKFEETTAGSAFVVYPSSDGPLWDVSGEKDLAYLERVLDEVARVYCADRTRVLVFGFSYGAKLANHLGCKRPGLARAIVSGAGSWVDGEPRCGAPLPVLVLNRTKDPDELVDWGRQAALRWAKVQHCDPKDATSKLGEGCTEFPRCDQGGGVSWCEDTWFDPSWPKDWNHTVRESYRALAWRWFLAQPPR